MAEAFGIEEWDRFQRIIEIDKDDFETAPEKTEDFMIIELSINPSDIFEEDMNLDTECYMENDTFLEL